MKEPYGSSVIKMWDGAIEGKSHESINQLCVRC